MEFELYFADVCGSASNKRYPHKGIITDEQALSTSVAHDYVCAEYYNNERSVANFIKSNCLAFDIDNDHTDEPSEWVTPADLEDVFPDVSFAVHFSKSHMKAKGTRTPRPKFHVFFPISEVKSADDYKFLKQSVYHAYPYFDKNALDVARFFFGTSTPKVEWHEGIFNIDDFLVSDEFDRDLPQKHFGDEPIEEGCRNATMSHFAGRVIKRYGDTDKAYEVFMEHSEQCTPPLEQDELDRIWSSARNFYKNTIVKSEGYVPADEYNQDFKYCPSDYSDLGQARVIAENLSERIAYNDAAGFMYYNGKKWTDSRQVSVGAVEELLDRQIEEAESALALAKQKLISLGIDEKVVNAGGKTLEKLIEPNERHAYYSYKQALAYVNFAQKRRDARFVQNAMLLAKPIVLREIQDFDKQEFLLNTAGGTCDLTKGVSGMREHRFDDYISKMCTCTPDRENEDLWLDAVQEFFCGDAELINYVQMCVGLACIGKVHQEALIIAYGEGCNGKSTFWNSIAQVLGDYAGTISADALTVGCKRNVKPEKAELKGKRLVIAAELEEGTRLNTSMVKQLCSTDPVTAEKKYKDPFKFTPSHTLVLYTNHLPRVGSSDDGTWRRLIVIPFNARIKPNNDIKNYTSHLVKECPGAILSWVIEGAKRAIDANFKFEMPNAVCDAISEYRETNDWLQAFFDEMCLIEPSAMQKSGQLYEEYRAWSLRSGLFARSTTDFYSALTSAGFERKKKKAGIFVLGIRLKDEYVL